MAEIDADGEITGKAVKIVFFFHCLIGYIVYIGYIIRTQSQVSPNRKT